jgi:hypothetical protein
MDNGEVRRFGETADVVGDYILQGVREGASVTFDPPHRFGNGMPAVLHSVDLVDVDGRARPTFSSGSPIEVRIRWEATAALYKPRIGFVLQTADGMDVLTSFDAHSWVEGQLAPGKRTSTCRLPAGLLNEGEYVLDFGTDAPRTSFAPGYDFTHSRTGPVVRFEVEDDMTIQAKYYGQEGFRDRRWPGVLLMNLPWTQSNS